MGRERGGKDEPICAQTISVIAPMNCGVAVVFKRAVSSSTILPIENQREAFSRSRRASSDCDIVLVLGKQMVGCMK